MSAAAVDQTAFIDKDQLMMIGGGPSAATLPEHNLSFDSDESLKQQDPQP